uniref:Cell cycle regulator of NHEJ n=1 Tax=Terrapene triunguis TaxID=2587831 RepID=A0A674IR65_9SAUR
MRLLASPRSQTLPCGSAHSPGPQNTAHGAAWLQERGEVTASPWSQTLPHGSVQPRPPELCARGDRTHGEGERRGRGRQLAALSRGAQTPRLATPGEGGHLPTPALGCARAHPAHPVRMPMPKPLISAQILTVTIYCMNEAELVDVALGVLQEGQQTPTEPQWSPASSGGASTPRPGPGPHAQPDALGCASRTDTEDDEDDALKYVREIFFS